MSETPSKGRRIAHRPTLVSSPAVRMASSPGPSSSPARDSSPDDDEKTIINFQPHPDTLTSSATYKFYASQGHPSLYYALAELIDNSLSATKGLPKREIEVRVYWDHEKPKNTVIAIMDNGCGMDREGLKTWATYKYSLELRNQKEGRPQAKSDGPPADRFLDEQISKYGAGGKEASFYVGKTVRLISKVKSDPGVFELELSDTKLKKKAANDENVYEETVIKRKMADYEDRIRIIGDAGDVQDETAFRIKEQVIQKILMEKEKPLIRDDPTGKDTSFTHIIISDVDHESHAVAFDGPMQKYLADIFAFYLHGPKGNIVVDPDDVNEAVKNRPLNLQNLNIFLKYFYIKKGKLADTPNFDCDLKKEVTNRFTKYIRNGVESLEFKEEDVMIDGKLRRGRFEAILYYYPYIMGRETFPGKVYSPMATWPEKGVEHDEDEDSVQSDDEIQVLYAKHEPHDHFNIFWSGRLIPCSTIPSLQWTTPSIRSTKDIPADCYQRIWGIIFLDNSFEVTQNKLTVSADIKKELESKESKMIMKRENGAWTKTRFNSEKFLEWLSNCHKKYDKEVIFTIPRGLLSGKDVNLPIGQYYRYENISLDGREKSFKKGDEVSIQVTKTRCIIGRIEYFLVFNPDSFRKIPPKLEGSGGYVCIQQEPISVHKPEFVPVSKLDVDATTAQIKKKREEEQKKFPHSITFKPYKKDATKKVHPDDDSEETVAVTEGCKIVSDPKIDIGAFEVDVLDFYGKSTKGKLPNGRSFSAKMVIKYHPPTEEQPAPRVTNSRQRRTRRVVAGAAEDIIQDNNPYYVEWGHMHFKKPRDPRLKTAGKYTIEISLPPNAAIYMKKDKHPLKINFEIVPNIAKTPYADIPFEGMDSVQAGVAFDFPIFFTDYDGKEAIPEETLGNKTKPERNYAIEITPTNVENITYKRTEVVGDTFWIRGMVIDGKLPVDPDDSSPVDAEFVVKFLGPKDTTPDVLDFGLECKPGPATKILMYHDDDPEIPEVKHNVSPRMGYELFDKFGNQVTRKTYPDVNLSCEFYSENRKAKGIFRVQMDDDGPYATSRYELFGQKSFKINMHERERLEGHVICFDKQTRAKGKKKLIYTQDLQEMKKNLMISEEREEGVRIEAVSQFEEPSEAGDVPEDRRNEVMDELRGEGPETMGPDNCVMDPIETPERLNIITQGNTGDDFDDLLRDMADQETVAGDDGPCNVKSEPFTPKSSPAPKRDDPPVIHGTPVRRPGADAPSTSAQRPSAPCTPTTASTAATRVINPFPTPVTQRDNSIPNIQRWQEVRIASTPIIPILNTTNSTVQNPEGTASTSSGPSITQFSRPEQVPLKRPASESVDCDVTPAPAKRARSNDSDPPVISSDTRESSYMVPNDVSSTSGRNDYWDERDHRSSRSSTSNSANDTNNHHNNFNGYRHSEFRLRHLRQPVAPNTNRCGYRQMCGDSEDLYQVILCKDCYRKYDFQNACGRR